MKKEITLKAWLTNLSHASWNKETEKYDDSDCTTKEVDVTLRINSATDVVKIVKGGVTGYESFHISDILDRPPSKGLHWCAGTPGRWDKLFMPQVQCEIMLMELREARQ